MASKFNVYTQQANLDWLNLTFKPSLIEYTLSTLVYTQANLDLLNLMFIHNKLI